MYATSCFKVRPAGVTNFTDGSSGLEDVAVADCLAALAPFFTCSCQQACPTPHMCTKYIPNINFGAETQRVDPPVLASHEALSLGLSKGFYVYF